MSIDIDLVHHLATLRKLTPLAREMLLLAGSYGRGAAVEWVSLLRAAFDLPQRRRSRPEKREAAERAKAALSELMLLGLMGLWRDNVSRWRTSDNELYEVTDMGMGVLRTMEHESTR